MKRFWDKVNKSSNVFGIDGNFPTMCWTWHAAITKQYGHFRFNDKMVYAHRFSWYITHGVMPKNKCVLHRCDNTICVRPDHLFLGTQIDNIKDMMQKGRHNNKGSGGPPGEQSGTAKLSNIQVLQIRKAFTSGASQASLSRKYKVSHGTIAAIVHRRSWKHI